MDKFSLLNNKITIMQAPMAGVSDAAFVAAASQAGALGSLGAGMMSPEEIHQAIVDIRTLTQHPFAVNLMILPPSCTQYYSQEMPSWLSDYYTKLDIGYQLAKTPAHDFEAQFAVLLEHPVPVASFTFGILTAKQVKGLHQKGTFVIGTANFANEVLAWAEAGADAVIVQGAEAGGHRGGWLHEERTPLYLDELLASALNALQQAGKKLPLIAAGGIATAEQAKKQLNNGAAMVSVGTAFLTTDEANIHPLYQQKLLSAKASDTRLTRLFSGKPARAIINEYMQAFEHLDGLACNLDLPEYPSLNAMTKSLRTYAAKHHDVQRMSLWAGMGVQHCQRLSAAQLVAKLGGDE